MESPLRSFINIITNNSYYYLYKNSARLWLYKQFFLLYCLFFIKSDVDLPPKDSYIVTKNELISILYELYNSLFY